MKGLRLFTCALLASAIGVSYANAQVSVRSGATNLPAQGTSGTAGPNIGGESSSISSGKYGDGSYGPGRYGPGNYGPGNYGPDKYIGGAGAVDTPVSGGYPQ
jgi:hypothetical protein